MTELEQSSDITAVSLADQALEELQTCAMASGVRGDQILAIVAARALGELSARLRRTGASLAEQRRLPFLMAEAAASDGPGADVAWEQARDILDRAHERAEANAKGRAR